MSIKYTKWTQNIPNDRKIDQMAIDYVYQHLPLQDPPKFTQIDIFGLKIWHLATLLGKHRIKDLFLNYHEELLKLVKKNWSLSAN
jgi:hypothetical protein